VKGNLKFSSKSSSPKKKQMKWVSSKINKQKIDRQTIMSSSVSLMYKFTLYERRQRVIGFWQPKNYFHE
jgi:hypothetical protein